MDSYFINLKSKIGLKIQGTRYNKQSLSFKENDLYRVPLCDNQTNHNIQYSTAKHGFEIWNLIIGVCLFRQLANCFLVFVSF